MPVDASVGACETANGLGLTSPSPPPSPPPPPYALCNPFSPKLGPRRRPSIIDVCVFSVDDVVIDSRLLRSLITAIEDSGATTEEHVQLSAVLRDLETVLLQAETHYEEVYVPAQRIVLDQAVQMCYESINESLASITKHDDSPSSHGTGSEVADVIEKVQWNLLAAEELAAFRHRILAHVQSMQTLLVTIQVSSMDTVRQQDAYHQSNTKRFDLMNSHDNSLMLINSSFDTLRQSLIAQGALSLQTLANVDAVRQTMITNNLMLLSAMKQLQDSLPPQVLLQKPVIFTDALDRVAPIHLEWISSWNAFLAVLELRFSHLGYNKIKRKEFALQETATRKDVTFNRPIDVSLTPGQRLDMSMIFRDRTGEGTTNTCPRCQAYCEGSTDSETTCMVCGCQFHRVQQQDDQPEITRNVTAIESVVIDVTTENSKKRKRPVDSASDEDVQPCDFKKLRMIWSSPPRSTVNFAGGDGKKARKRLAPPGRCHSCGTVKTPRWVREPNGSRTLCEECGLHYARLTRKMSSNKTAKLNSRLRHRSPMSSKTSHSSKDRTTNPQLSATSREKLLQLSHHSDAYGGPPYPALGSDASVDHTISFGHSPLGHTREPFTMGDDLISWAFDKGESAAHPTFGQTDEFTAWLFNESESATRFPTAPDLTSIAPHGVNHSNHAGHYGGGKIASTPLATPTKEKSLTLKKTESRKPKQKQDTPARTQAALAAREAEQAARRLGVIGSAFKNLFHPLGKSALAALNRGVASSPTTDGTLSRNA